jgi:hypothetical protein
MVEARKVGEGKDRGVLRMAGGQAENAERRERESDVEKTEWKSLLKRLPRTLAEYIAKERS